MIVEELSSLLLSNLIINSPRLSGNMKNNIKIVEFGEHEVKIEISAKFYDMAIWNQYKSIVFTGKNYKGITDYPMWVNKVGAFGKHNKSEKFANRICYDVCQVIANQYGGTVINELEL